jgi:RNA polymerase sigma factor (sigma-70 family)
MANADLDSVLRHIRGLVAAEDLGALPDRELLDRFVRRRDEAAFAALVRRHGALVLGICRRLLRDAHDAEDACQAVFLVLARKAASIRPHASLASWLHGVAYRVSANLKRQVARRRALEEPVGDVPDAGPAEPSWREVRAVLDEELNRLPERIRAPLVLCYLEGKTRDEAARELGWGLGTLRGRLERGRKLLRARLTRRGLALSCALLAGLLSAKAAALPPTLAVAIVHSAGPVAAGEAPAGVVSERVAALLEGVLRAMLLTRRKIVTAVLFTLTLAGLGAGLAAYGPFAARQADARPAARTAREDDPPPARRPVDRAELAKNRSQSRENLKKLALAMHAYADDTGHLPSPP